MEQISPLQIAYLLATIRAAIMLALVPVVAATPHGHDAWLAALVATFLGLIPAWLASQVANMLPGQDLVQICETCLGKVVGKFVSVLYLGFFAMNAAVVLRQFSDFLTTAPMPETPSEFFLATMALTTAYGIRKGIEVIARINELLLPPLVVFVLLVLALGIKDMDPHRVKPILAEGWGPVLLGGLMAGSLWAETVIVTMLAPLLKNPRPLFRYAAGSVLVGGLWLLLLALAVITFFSAPEAQVQIFPLYSLMRTISVGDFLERLDPLFLLVWTVASILKLSLLSYASVKILARILGLSDYRSLALPMGFAGAAVALLQFESIADLRAFNSPYVLPVVVFPFGVLFPLLLLMTGRLRGAGGKGA